MDGLRVPKHSVAVVVGQTDGTLRQMGVFLADGAGTHAGPERPSDAFGAGSGFIPAVDTADGSFVCLNLEHVAYVRVAAVLEPPETELHTIPTEHEVQVVLSGGALLDGLVSYVRPQSSARLSDFLNEPTPLLRLLAGDDVVLVRKQRIVRIVSRSS